MSSVLNQIRLIGIEKLQRGKYQPRREFDPILLEELSMSIQAKGIIQPLVVRQIDNNLYEIIAGERRWRAAQLVNLHEVPCIVRQESDASAAEIALIENIQRDDLNPIEEAQALQRLIDEFSYLHEEVAAVVGKSREKITNLIRLLKLDPRLQELIKTKALSEGHGKLLVSLEMPLQWTLAEQAVKYGWSVRKLEQAVKKSKEPKPKKTGNEPDIQLLERLISEQLGTPVQVEPDGGYLSGELKIKFYNNETLAGILDRLGVKY